MARKSAIQKECRRCKVNKSISDYGPCKSTIDKLQVWCKQCRRQYAMDRYNADKAGMNARRSKLYHDKKAKKAAFQAFIAPEPVEEVIEPPVVEEPTFKPEPAPENPFAGYIDSVDDIIV